MRSILVSADGVTPLVEDLDEPDYPAGLTVVTTLEIVLRLNSENFVLASYFGYPHMVGGVIREGHWAPPAVATPLDVAPGTWETGQAVIDAFKLHAPGDFSQDARKLMSMMGVEGGMLQPNGEMIEIKRSIRVPYKRAYRVIRYRWMPARTSTTELRNLVDPLCHRGFAFIPTKWATLRSYTRSGQLPKAGEELFFLGKPVVSNLEHLLCAEGRHLYFKEDSGVVKVERKHLVLEEKGALVQVDMAGFGAACAFTEAHGGTYVQTGSAATEIFRHRLLASFSEILACAGVSQARLAGDGFLCAIPERSADECTVEQRLRRLLNAYRDHLELIERMNASLPARDRETYAIGSRLAIHYGKYNYGRVAGLVPLVADFDGPAVIQVARAEGGLKLIAREIDGKGRRGRVPASHRAIVSEAAMTFLGGEQALTDLMGHIGFNSEGLGNTQAKEARVEGNVFAWPRQGVVSTKDSTNRNKPMAKKADSRRKVRR
jgi:hypothetical protein